MKHIIKQIIIAATVLLAGTATGSAGLIISAETDKQTVEINDNFSLAVTVTGDSTSIPDPVMPPMGNFNVYSSGRSQNISIINGKISTSISFSYVLSPRFLGVQKIPPIQVTDGKEKYFTKEIEINVVKASGTNQQAQQQPAQTRSRPGRAARAQAGNALFLTAETDKKTAYPGEQINLTIRFFTSIPLTSNPQYLAPQFKNLIAEDLPPVRSGETVIKGVRYAYNEIKTALFALEEGTARVEPASVTAQTHGQEDMDPFDPNFFQNFFSMRGGQGETVQLKSELVTLKILPFPPNAPASFKGAVGNFTITADLDRDVVKAGEAVNLSVTIAGEGNLKTLSAPKLPEIPAFKAYDTLSSLDIKKENDNLKGKKIFTTVLIARNEGRQTIPRIEFSFFDAASKTYRTLTAGPFEVIINKGDGKSQSISFSGETRTQDINAVASDIRYVSDSPEPFWLRLLSHIEALPVWLHILPLFGFLLSLWLAKTNEFKLKNPRLFRFKKAYTTARLELDQAAGFLKKGEGALASALLYDSLQNYLSDKAGIKLNGLTIKKAQAALAEKFRNADPARLEQIKELWEELEALHFYPGGASGERLSDLLARYSALLPELEKEFKHTKH